MRIIKLLITIPAVVSSFGLKAQLKYEKPVSNTEGYLYAINDKEISLSLKEIQQMALCEYNKESDIQFGIEKSEIIKDFADNEYLFSSFAPSGFSIISLSNLETLEVNYFSEFDFSQYDFKHLRYLPLFGLWDISVNGYKNIFTNQFLDNSSCVYLASHYQFSSVNDLSLLESNYESKKSYVTSSGDDSEHTHPFRHRISEGEITATYEVDYSWFFKYNDNQFAYDDDKDYADRTGTDKLGLCEYVALGILMEYYDFFKCAGYFSDSQIDRYVTPSSSTSNYKNSIPTVDDSLILDLFALNMYERNLRLSQFNNLFNAFMSNKNMDCSVQWSVLGLWNIKNKIRNDKLPIMLCGDYPKNESQYGFHNIIAYGAFNDGTNVYNGKYLVHYGWRGFSQCIVSKSAILELYEWRLVDNSSSNHVHRNVFNINNVLQCGSELPL